MDKYLFGNKPHGLEFLCSDVLWAAPPPVWRIGEHSFHTDMALLKTASLLAALSFPLFLLQPVLGMLKGLPRGDIDLEALNELPACKAQPAQAIAVLQAIFVGARALGFSNSRTLV